ncbi:MAG: DUF4430 domain-containing protein [Firmicutes bacterium]|nr:DUF4430 domain-containing protein [Bacillota bacterium]
MKKSTEKGNRILSVLLAFVMVICMMPAMAFAEETEGEPVAPPAAVDNEAVLQQVYEVLTEKMGGSGSDDWIAADIAEYERAYGKEAALTQTKIQQYINYVAEKGAQTKSAGDLSKYIIGLKALGYDGTKVVTVNQSQGTHLNLVERLAEIVTAGTGGSNSVYTLPYILIALNQDETYGTEELRSQVIERMLNQQLTDGGWGYGTTVDVDAVAPAILAMAPYYDTNEQVKEAIDKALEPEKVKSFMGETGAVVKYNAPNANATGMLLAAMAAVGKDVNDYAIDGKTLIDGLLALRSNEPDGFQYNNKWNLSATEQGFRGLLAVTLAEKQENKQYMIYDFHENGSKEAKATAGTAVTPPSEPTKGDDITVTVTVKTDTGIWLNEAPVTMKKTNAKVYHALLKALADANMSQRGADNGYVESITKDGVTLAAFDKGPNSGWLYKVNDTLPIIPLTVCNVEDGDKIVWYYTADYTKDPAASVVPSQPKGPAITLTDEKGMAIDGVVKTVYDAATGKLTITTTEEYQVKDVLVNGVSKGAVMVLTGLTGQDKVTVILEKLEKQDEKDVRNKKLIQGVQSTGITLKTVDTGKGYIQVEWTKEKGYKVDGYQVFRSVKKTSGFSKKAFFSKKSDGTQGSYKNTKGLKSGTRYYYKVRGYRIIDGKTYYTEWSNKAWWTAR